MDTWIGTADSWQRAWVVVVALLTTTGVAFLRHGRESRRWRECLFLVAGALVGGVFGALFDRVTFELSPVYYASASPEVSLFALPDRVARHGFRTGFAAAGFVCIVCLLASGAAFRSGTFDALIRRMLPIGVDALSLSAAAGMVAFFADAEPWQIVWALHAGMTIGAALGLGLVLRGLCTARA